MLGAAAMWACWATGLLGGGSAVPAAALLLRAPAPAMMPRAVPRVP